MRKQYPYLIDPYYENFNTANKKREFLKKIDNFINQKQYVRITLLDWNEAPLKEIAGEVTSGSITKDSSSSVRRTVSFQCSVDYNKYFIEDQSMDFAINKKVFIEIGIKNYTDEYPQYPILWFPQGVFFISSFSASSASNSAIQISLTLKDKMAGLNGEVGGTFPTTVILDTLETQNTSGEYVTEKVLVYNIIRELVNHFGGDSLNNIVIEDVPLRIKRVLKWNGSNPLYIQRIDPTNSGEAVAFNFKTELAEGDDKNSYTQYNNGYDIGYEYDDFFYTSDLTANAGETVTSVLDKIVQYLGNYEYFYDEYGIFHFREIKNYLNTSQGKVALDEMDKNNYLIDVNMSKSIYSFTDNNNIISINLNPQYENIKNDYVIQGKRQGSNDSQSYPVRYHLVIDNKPKPIDTDNQGNYYNEYKDLVVYVEPETSLTKIAFPVTVNVGSDEQPLLGNFSDLASKYMPGDLSLIYTCYDVVQETPIFHYKDGVSSERLGDFLVPNDGEKEDQNNKNQWLTLEDTGNPFLNNKGEQVVYKEYGQCFYYWSGETYKMIDEIKAYYPKDEIPNKKISSSDIYYGLADQTGIIKKTQEPYRTRDWRTEIYMQGLLARIKGTDANTYYNNLANKIQTATNRTTSWVENVYSTIQSSRVDSSFYFEELESFWPTIYDLETQKFYGDETKYVEVIDSVTQEKVKKATQFSLTDGNYFLDMIDATESGLGQFSIANIGRRSDVVSKDEVNCLFAPEIPDVIIITIGADDQDERRNEAVDNGEPVMQIPQNIAQSLRTGGYKNPAFDQIKYELYLHTSYQTSLSITARPIFYLEPNSRVSISDRSTNTYGDYIIQSLSLPLGGSGTMSVSCTEALERF